MNLSAYLAVNDAIRERVADDRRALTAHLKALDEFNNPTKHEEYQPS
ncbi:hypothetical protein [Streptomyces sp. NPDC048489]